MTKNINIILQDVKLNRFWFSFTSNELIKLSTLSYNFYCYTDIKIITVKLKFIQTSFINFFTF